MRKRANGSKDADTTRRAVTIGPMEVLLIGKTIEALRTLPECVNRSELWDHLEAILFGGPEGCPPSAGAPVPE